MPKPSTDQRVLLVVPPHAEGGGAISHLPPMGPLYLTAYLRQHGVAASCVDLHNSRRPLERLRRLLTDQRPHVVGFSVLLSNVQSALRCIELTRQHDAAARIVAGGPYVTTQPQTFDAAPLDAIFIGEAEQALLDYVRGKDPETIDGLRWREGAELVGGLECRREADLDSLPWPALGDVELKRYRSFVYRARPLSSIITSRGCPYRCIFCTHAVAGHTFRARSPESVVAEMAWQVRSHGVREIVVSDDNFSYDGERVERICHLLRREKLDLTWQAQNGLRVDRVNKPMLRAMREAGCWTVSIAPESGDPHILKKIRKGFTLDQVRQARRWCRELGLVTHANFMMGFPWDTAESLRRTIDFAVELDAEITHFSRVFPLPDTDLTRYLDEEGLMLPDRSVRDFDYYHNPRLYRLPHLSDQELDALVHDAHKRYYRRPLAAARLLVHLPGGTLATLAKRTLNDLKQYL